MLGEKKREENLRFRTFMKSRDHSDRILRRIAEGIEDEIDCTICANCCRVATATVKERDIEHLARFLRISEARFVAEYTTESEDEGRILRRTDSRWVRVPLWQRMHGLRGAPRCVPAFSACGPRKWIDRQPHVAVRGSRVLLSHRL